MTLTSEQILQQVRAHQNGVGLNNDGVGLNNNGVGLTQHGVGLTDLIEKRAQNGVGLSENTAENSENGVGLSENTMEKSENTMQNTEKTKNLPQNGVGYYNKDNKDNRDNKDNGLLRSSSGQASPKSQSSTSQSVSCQSPTPEPLQSLVSLDSKGVIDSPETKTDGLPDYAINEKFVQRALFTLFHNPDAQQKSKFKITINPHYDPKQKIEFIGALTKDMRNFKKYLPEGVDADIIHDEYRRLKKQNGTAPYVGKVHVSFGQKAKSQRTQNEPYSFVIVWYDPEEKGWKFTFQLHRWHMIEKDLFSDNLTEKQVKSNVKATEFWYNPEYEKGENTRNKTFLQMQQEKNND